jgi:TolB protein
LERIVKINLGMTTCSLIVALPLACVSCSTSTGDLAGRPAAGPVDIVHEPGGFGPVAAPSSEPTLSEALGRGYDFNAADELTVAPARNAGSATRATMIGLYGEIAGESQSSSEPSDGGRNLRQVSYAEEGACFDPEIDRSGRWLVFASTRHQTTSDIYLKATHGKTITQITNDPANDVMPAFDPSGERIAFASNRAGAWNLYITTIDGGPAIQMTDSPDDELHPSWSPDGRHLAYCRLGSQSGRWELWTVDVNNPGVHRFLDYGLFPQWSPDIARNKILFQRSRGRGSRYHAIWTVDVIEGEAMYPTEIVSAANAAAINPTWSPDGRRIAFVTVVDPEAETGGTPSLADIWVINIDGSGRAMLTHGEYANFQPVWSPDESVYFVSDRSGRENIWAVSTVGLRFADHPRSGGIATVDPGWAGPPSRP